MGNCFNDDSDEVGKRVRALFQNRGYFLVEVRSVKLKPADPLGIPKPVTLGADVIEGPKFKVGGNHVRKGPGLPIGAAALGVSTQNWSGV